VFKESGSVRSQDCPSCSASQVSAFLDISSIPVNCSELFVSPDSARLARTAPLNLSLCLQCGMIFNSSFDEALLVYNGQYENSLDHSPTFRAYAESLAQRLIGNYDLRGKNVLEIGCGQAVFLRRICELGANYGFGFDPSYVGPAALGPVRIQSEYYTGQSVGATPDLVVCRHVLEHIPSPAAFLGDLHAALSNHPQTVLYIEVPNADAILDGSGLWDLIYPHCSYFSSSSLSNILRRSGFEVITTGTSYSGQFLYAEARPGWPAAVPEFPDIDRYVALTRRFSNLVHSTIERWSAFIERSRARGYRTALWGSGAKGVTFLNLLPDPWMVEAVIDINPRKHGTFVPVTGHRVLSPEESQLVLPKILITPNPVYAGEIGSAVGRLGLRAKVLAAVAA
jgi:SAM-dependent methyltransferase